MESIAEIFAQRLPNATIETEELPRDLVRITVTLPNGWRHTMRVGRTQDQGLNSSMAASLCDWIKTKE